MEPDVAAELTVSASQHLVQVNILVGDEDSSTIKKVRESVTHDAESGRTEWMLKGHLEPLCMPYRSITKASSVLKLLSTC